ncbi:MAG: zinc-ribbon domain-containing protein [Thermodesulfobacteriota bacterium]
MVIKCSHCKGLMRVDEARIPKGGGVKVRCPHCDEVGYVPARDVEVVRETKPVPATSDPSNVPPPHFAEAARPPVSRQPEKPNHEDATLPEDAFHDFRFPAERPIVKKNRNPAPRKRRILVWVAVSVAVVAFFALFVNLMLPGPSGQRPFSGEAPVRSGPEQINPSPPSVR